MACEESYYAAYPLLRTARLPVWPLGCVLAEQAETLRAMSSGVRIWLWRLAIWLGCWPSEMLHCKARVLYMRTMPWFGILAYFWVKNEIAYGKQSSPNRYLVAAGAWELLVVPGARAGDGVVLAAAGTEPGICDHLAWDDVVEPGCGVCVLHSDRAAVAQLGAQD